MSTAANSYYFRRRTIGRAASPPTWACYEQIHDGGDYSDSDSDSDSCSEDDDDYNGGNSRGRQGSSDSEESQHSSSHGERAINNDDGQDDLDMDVDEDAPAAAAKDRELEKKKDVKGKQRAVDPEPETPRRQRKAKRQHVYTLRPILTIHKSQGFVWNQDLFVPPYIKDRYIASTSPPNSRGFISSSVSSNNSAFTDYEVEVVEIRVKEGDLDEIIP